MGGPTELKTGTEASRTPSSRRDARHRIGGSGSLVTCAVPLSVAGAQEATLTTLSVAGLAYEVDGPSAHEPGTRLVGLEVRVGNCTIQGDAVVRSSIELGPGRFEVGCLFFPASSAEEDRWMAVIAGIEVAMRA